MSENATASTASAVELQAVCDAPELSLTRVHADDAGLDLASAIDFDLARGVRALSPTGVRIARPPGTVGLVCTRFGVS